MKTIFKVIIVLAILFFITGFVYNVFNTSLDEKKLYITCLNTSSDYEVLTGEKINFAKNNDECKVNFEIMNVDDGYIKLKANKYFFSIDGNKNIDEDTASEDIFVVPNEELIKYSVNKKTKYIFEYK